jgi:hypothetical protein
MGTQRPEKPLNGRPRNSGRAEGTNPGRRWWRLLAAAVLGATTFSVAAVVSAGTGAVSPGGVARPGLDAVACPNAIECIAVGVLPGAGAVVRVVAGIPSAPVPVPGATELTAVGCANRTYCEAVGQVDGEGVVVPVVNGDPGTAEPVPGTTELTGVACGAPGSCMAVGSAAASNGVFVPITRSGPGAVQASSLFLGQVACPASTLCLAAGSFPGEIVPIVDAVALAPVPVPGTTQLQGIACARYPTTAGNFSCMATGQYYCCVFEGYYGETVPFSAATTGSVELHPLRVWTGTGSLNLVACAPGTTSCVAAGQGYTPPNFPIPPPITVQLSGTSVTFITEGLSFSGLACATASICVGVNGGPNVQVLLAAEGVPGASSLDAVACGAAGSCVAVGSNGTQGVVAPVSVYRAGRARTATGSDALDGVACGGPVSCLAVGSVGGTGVVVPVFDGAPGAAVPVVGTEQLSAVACARSTCEAVGTSSSGGGVAVRVSDGVVGTPVSVAGVTALQGVSCATTVRCEAVGSAPGPSGPEGVIVPVVGGVTGAVQMVAGASGLDAVACPTSGQCVAVGGTPLGLGAVVPVTNGTAEDLQPVQWPYAGTPANPSSGALTSVSCADYGHCVSVGSYYSPYGGSGAVTVPIADGVAGTSQGFFAFGSLSGTASAADGEAVVVGGAAVGRLVHLPGGSQVE